MEMSNKRGRGNPEETVARRALIKEWVMKEGLTNREEMKRRLFEKGYDVTRATIYNDFKCIAAVSQEELKEFELDVMGQFKKMIQQLDTMISCEMDVSKKAQLIRTLSQVMKDRHAVAANIALHGTPGDKEKHEKRNTEEVNIVFG